MQRRVDGGVANGGVREQRGGGTEEQQGGRRHEVDDGGGRVGTGVVAVQRRMVEQERIDRRGCRQRWSMNYSERRLGEIMDNNKNFMALIPNEAINFRTRNPYLNNNL